MSIGLPIVASNVIGNCDAIDHGKSGFLYELHNENNAVYYLKKLSGNIDLIGKMGLSAFKRQRNYFSENLMISKYINLYKDQFLKSFGCLIDYFDIYYYLFSAILIISLKV